MTKSGKSALLSTVSVRTLAITGAALASLTLLGACDSVRSYDSTGARPAASSIDRLCAVSRRPDRGLDRSSTLSHYRLTAFGAHFPLIISHVRMSVLHHRICLILLYFLVR